mmetsp:Transcript_36957/g.99568  ORF Transcript_36957/g.99568 Transcript_36957/m.99568 type:complete len:236 (+) Transcript_36957:557-1264(+)
MAFAWRIARGVGYAVAASSAAVGGAGTYVCWEPHLLLPSHKLMFAWAFLMYIPVAIIADYVVELEFFPGAEPPFGGVLPTNYLLQLIMGGFLIPVPMQAKWTVARSRTFSETKWKNVLIHTVKLNLLNFGIIVHMVGFLYDRFFLANSTNFWVTMLVRPLVINGVRWGVAHRCVSDLDGDTRPRRDFTAIIRGPRALLCATIIHSLARSLALPITHVCPGHLTLLHTVCGSSPRT